MDAAAAELCAAEALGEVGVQAFERDALLGHRVAVAHRDGTVIERIEVDRDTERGADLVLAAVATTDRTGVVDDSDFALFANAYDLFNTESGDLNGDTRTDDADFIEFASAYNALVCP